MQADKLPRTEYWASDYVHEKVVRITSVKCFSFNMGAALGTGGQKGSYRPKVDQLDEHMEQLKNATKEALNERTDQSVAGFLDWLVDGESYQLFE
jgi:antirestriction protein ArdC